jgi:SNF2 family DNA or RNA helicase
MEMGTGKTKVAIDWAGIGFYNFGLRKVLVVAPLSVLGVWPRQIRQHAGYPARIIRLDGSSDHRVQVLQRIMRAEPLGSDEYVRYVIINYEGIWRENRTGVSIEKLLIAWRPDLVVFDESHRLKSPTSRQSKSAHRIAKQIRMRLILSGTPITKAPLDIFGQFRAMNEDIFGTNWFHFKFMYGVWGGYGKYQLKGYRNLKGLASKIRANSFRIKKEQCLDLPPKLFETVPVTLPDSIMKLYRQMAEEMIIEIEETHATAAIVLVKLLRLSQITNGFVKDVDGNIRILDNSKLNTCLDLVDDLLEEDHKVVIFARFRSDIERIAAELDKRKVHYAILSGSVPGNKRDSLVQRFHRDPNLKVFIAQIQAGSLGIDLTPADTAIFYSLDYNAANYWQAQDRLHRHGQDRKVTYYHLIAPRTIDQVVLSVLKAKGNLAEAVIHNPRKLLLI